MKRIVAVNYVSAENRAEYLRIMGLLAKESRKEPGCIHYMAYEDVSDAGVITMLEEWKDLEAIEAHNNSPHFKMYLPKLLALCEKEGVVRVYSPIDELF